MKFGALSSCVIPISLAFVIYKMGIKICTSQGLGVGLTPTQMEGDMGLRLCTGQLLSLGLVRERGRGGGEAPGRRFGAQAGSLLTKSVFLYRLCYL